MLLPRVLTALVGIPLLLWVIHLGSLPFALFVVGAAVLALHEYALLLRLGGRGVQRSTTVAGGGFVAAAVALGEPGTGGWAHGGLVGMAVTALLLTSITREMLRRQHSLDRAALSVFGALFIGWTLAHLALLRGLRPRGEAYTMLLFVTVWGTDSAAYVAGSLFGSRKLAPVVSPKKTWEGAAAGLAAAVACVLAARSWGLKDSLGLGGALALGLLIGVVGQASDLAESVIKRAVGAKDSSHLLPGHGGVLDRFDSFLLTAPLMYYALALRSP